MIIHRHDDGSERFQYQVGDRVIVERTINGGWFDFGPTRAERCVVEKVDGKSHWRIAMLEVRFSPEWGPATCLPWMVKPHEDTRLAATVLAPADGEVKPGRVTVPDETVTDPLDDLVKRFSIALLEKLKAARIKYGFGGELWRETDWEEDCQQSLLRHLAKGDPRDVAAYCAFMWHHGWSTIAPDEAASPRTILSSDCIDPDIEEAIRADEREKCAAIAANHSFAMDIDWWLNATKRDVSAESCRSVAAAIRGRKG